GIFASGALTGFAPPSRRERRRRWDSRGNHQLGAPLNAARRKGLLGTPEGLLDIVLEVGVEEWEGAGEPREVPLRDPQHDGILKRYDEPGAERRTDQHALAEMLAEPEYLLEMLACFGIVDSELQRALDHGVEAVDQHAGLEHRVTLAVMNVACARF